MLALFETYEILFSSGVTFSSVTDAFWLSTAGTTHLGLCYSRRYVSKGRSSPNITHRLVPTTPSEYEINGFGCSITDLSFGYFATSNAFIPCIVYLCFRNYHKEERLIPHNKSFESTYRQWARELG